MRHAFACVLLTLPLLGCRPELAAESAIRAVVHYQGFRPGCVRLVATDGDGAHSADATVSGSDVPASTDDTLQIAVYRGDTWGHTLTLTAMAYEVDCNGHEVASDPHPAVEVMRGKVLEQDFTLQATDQDGDGYVAQPAGTDCNDTDPTIHPNAPEVCDGVDRNCDGKVNEGFNVGANCLLDGGCGTVACAPDGGTACANVHPATLAYPDRDHDGYGAADAGPVLLCSGLDAGFSLSNTDCDDTRANVYPGAPELCDGLDNNCNGAIDEGFNVGNPCSGDGGCSGNVACAPDGGSQCNFSLPVVTFYFDGDNDGYGATASGVQACLPPDAGYVQDGGDCDDGDPFTHPGASEICDARDNNCNGQVDEGGVCPANATWTPHLANAGESYATASAWGIDELWVAGSSPSGARYKLAGDPTFYNANCGGNWSASWADVTDGGRVFLGGGNTVVQRDPVNGGTCLSYTLSGTTGGVTGLVGLRTGGTLVLYGVGNDGRAFNWDGGSSTSNSNPGGRLFDVHGVSPDTVFAVGDTGGGGPSVSIFRFTPASNTWAPQLSSPPRGTLHGVWVAGPNLAYAVGGSSSNSSLLYEWDGTSWTSVTPPDAGTLHAVLAFGTNDVYVASGTQLFRSNGSSWDTLYTLDAGTGSIVDLTGVSPADVWAPTSVGYIVHWPN